MSDLSTIKAGDRVTELDLGRPRAILTVKRTTKTLIVTACNRRWRRATGCRLGSYMAWDRRITCTTDEHRSTIGGGDA